MSDDTNYGLIKWINKFNNMVDPYDRPIEEYPSWKRFIMPVVYSKPYTFLESLWWNGLQLPSVEKPKPKPKKFLPVYRPDHEFTPQQIEEAKRYAHNRAFDKYVRATSRLYNKARSTYCPMTEESKIRRDKLEAELYRRLMRDERNIDAGKFSPYIEFKKRLDKELPCNDAGTSKSPERIQQEIRNPHGKA